MRLGDDPSGLKAIPRESYGLADHAIAPLSNCWEAHMDEMTERLLTALTGQ